MDHHQIGAAPARRRRGQSQPSGRSLRPRPPRRRGVTFLTVVAVNRLLRTRGWYGPERPEPDLLQWLDLVALGTICDVVPLWAESRLRRQGPPRNGPTPEPGLAALADVARLGGPVAPYHLGFVLGPRINAGGRIGDAALGARLLASNEPAECAASRQNSIASTRSVRRSRRRCSKRLRRSRCRNRRPARGPR